MLRSMTDLSVWYDICTFINLCSVGPELDKFGTIWTQKCWSLREMKEAKSGRKNCECCLHMPVSLQATFTVWKKRWYSSRKLRSCLQTKMNKATMFATWSFLTLLSVSIIQVYYRWSLTSSVFLLSWQLRILGGDWHSAVPQKKAAASPLKEEENWSTGIIKKC